MEIKIISPTFELTPYIRQKIESKVLSLQRIVKSFEKNKKILVTVEIKKTTKHHKHGNIFETIIKLDLNGSKIAARGNGTSFQTALDIAKDKIKENIIKYKERQIEEKHST
jgi:ribosomal subunit interface protein